MNNTGDILEEMRPHVLYFSNSSCTGCISNFPHYHSRFGFRNICIPGPDVLKNNFMLNSAEPEIFPAHKC